MIEKEVTIRILEEIQEGLYSDNWKSKTLSIVSQYRKGLLIAVDPELKKLIAEQNKYEEDSYKAKELSKMIDDRIRKIYSS